MRRRRTDLSFQGKIQIQQNVNAGTLAFTDDGVGLTAQEAEDYLGTLGAGITGLIKRGEAITTTEATNDQGDLIGQFGVGLFSAFMLADRLIVESKSDSEAQGIRWEAGAGTDINLSTIPREASGTTVTLVLKPDFIHLAKDTEALEKAVREYADFLPVPIFINDNTSRSNVIHVAWFEASQDTEATELALQQYFDEAPLAVIPIRQEQPASLAGALYVTPQRVPGFGDAAAVMVTVRRMVISRRIQGLLPDWASFLRGSLELHDCAPTASREDLVRNQDFNLIKESLEEILFDHLEQLALHDATRMESIINWHRYTFAGSALHNARLRNLLRTCYRLPTSVGPLSIAEILEKSAADPLYEDEAERVVWYNSDRRQERWVNSLFNNQAAICVHTFRSFEESLLVQSIADDHALGTMTDLRIASPSAPNFASSILGIRDLEEISSEWNTFFEATDAKVLTGSFRSDQPVMAFLNERYQLAKSFDELKERGDIPGGFQRLIDNHFRDAPAEENEVIINRNHPLVKRALSQKPGMPLSSVLRLLVSNALNSAGAATPTSAQKQQQDDLDWIAQCLWGKD